MTAALKAYFDEAGVPVPADLTVAALTGRSGCGKSTVAAYFRTAGYPVLDADKVAAAVMEEYPACVRELAEAFGADILDAAGRLLRRKLADRAFSTPEGQKILTGITHPYIIRSLLEKIQAEALHGADLVFVDGAVIVGEPFEVYCDKIVVVDAPEEQQIARLCTRDGITEEQARRRIGAQLSRQRLNAAADAVICNDGTLEHLLRQAQTALQTLQADLRKNL